MIFGIVFIDLVGFGIVIPVLPLYAERFGASPLVIGWLLGIYSAMQCLCAPILGRISDRVGRRPVLIVSVLGTAAGFLLMGVATSLKILFVARIIDGVTGGNISTALAYIADVTPPEQRSKNMGLIGAAFGLGFIVGPALGGLLSHVSLSAPFLFAAALAGANAIALTILLPESLPPERRGRPVEQKAPWTTLLRTTRRPHLAVILATYFLTTVAFSLLTATYPLFTNRRFGYGATQNGYIFAVLGLIGAIVQGGLLGWLLKVWNDRGLAIAGTVALMASLVFLPTSGTIAGLLAVTAGMAVGHGLVASTLNGMASKSTDAASQGRVLGLMQSSASLARIVGPVMGGWLLNYDATQMTLVFGRTPYWAAAAVMLVATLLAVAL